MMKRKKVLNTQMIFATIPRPKWHLVLPLPHLMCPGAHLTPIFCGILNRVLILEGKTCLCFGNVVDGFSVDAG